jgi:hypothetical protein
MSQTGGSLVAFARTFQLRPDRRQARAAQVPHLIGRPPPNRPRRASLASRISRSWASASSARAAETRALAGADASAATDADASRVIQGVITGVRFLGTGVILHRGTGDQMVHGLSTAATIWITASLGVLCGLAVWPLLRHCRPYRPPINLRRRSRQAAAGPPL